MKIRRGLFDIVNLVVLIVLPMMARRAFVPQGMFNPPPRDGKRRPDRQHKRMRK